MNSCPVVFIRLLKDLLECFFAGLSNVVELIIDLAWEHVNKGKMGRMCVKLWKSYKRG